jgi:dipeptidyl aminopeptidase/acylaminoacyl peptidase
MNDGRQDKAAFIRSVRANRAAWRATTSVASTIVMLTLSVEAQPTRGVTVDDLMRVRTIVDARISPTGDRVAYVVSTPSVEKNIQETALFVVPSAGGTAQRIAEDRQIFTPSLPAPRLRWAPDGRSITFLGLGGNRPQVFSVASTGGPTRALTTATMGVSVYDWSPDGTRLAFISREPSTPGTVVRAGTPDAPTRLWVQAVDGEAKAITPRDQYVDSFSWAPGGQEIAYSASPITGFLAGYSTRIYGIELADGKRRTIVDRDGMNTAPVVSPDGSSIAFVSTHGEKGILASRGLAVVSAKGDRVSPVRPFRLAGAWIAEIVWASDSQSLFVTMNEGTFATGAQMFEMPVVRVALADGNGARVVPGETVDYSISITRDGRTMVYRAVEGRNTGDLFVHDLASGARRQLTEVNPELKGMTIGTLRPISWRSFDGKEIWGLLLLPADRAAGQRLPLIVYCHGGPIGGVTFGLFPQFAHTVGQIDPYPVDAMASAGYAVFFPMPRGGSGYGEEGHRAIVNSWGESDYKDIMAGVDHLIAQGVADPDRLGVMGASYGGFMTNWIVTQTGRFKAAASAASISDLNDLYYLPDGGDLMIEYFKRPWENRESYAAHSPLTFAEKVTTPLLIQHGDRDPRVPISNAQKFYRALKGMGKVVEYDLYPGGGHVYYEPRQQQASMTRALEWFQRWIPTKP